MLQSWDLSINVVCPRKGIPTVARQEAFDISFNGRSGYVGLSTANLPEHEFHTWTDDEIAQYEEGDRSDRASGPPYRADPSLETPCPRRNRIYGTERAT